MAVSGILDVNDALLLTARRAKLIGAKCVADTSGMVTCKSTVDEIGALLNRNDQKFKGLSIACLNTLTDIVVAGPADSLLRFVDYCKGSGIKAKQLTVPYGFHSSAMDPMLQDLGVCASAIRFNRSKIMFGSSLYGKLLDLGESLDPGYFVRHTRDSVNFYRVIEDIRSSFSGCESTFIEIGPYPSSKL